jgi:hypothetical protein
MNQLIAHLVGDYVLQSHWMAVKKTKWSWPCALHAFAYTLPFVCLTRSLLALTVIMVSHFVIDRWQLVRYVIWLNNLIYGGPRRFEWCRMTGYFDPEVARVSTADIEGVRELCTRTNDHEFRMQDWLRVWLKIINDNTLHLATNAVCLAWL